MPVLKLTELFKYKIPVGSPACCNVRSMITIGLMDCGMQTGVHDLQRANLTVEDFTSCANIDDNLLSHGTFSASLLVAQGDSLLSGLVPNARLLMAQVVNQYGHAEENPILRALTWFQSEGADVIAIPLGAFHANSDIDCLLSSLAASNVLIFAAAGNQHPSPTLFPANHPDVIAVGACDRHGKILPDCCRSPEPDLLLPGENIPSLINGDVIAGRSGTSVACVLAAGMAVACLSSDATSPVNVNRSYVLDILRGVRMAD